MTPDKLTAVGLSIYTWNNWRISIWSSWQKDDYIELPLPNKTWGRGKGNCWAGLPLTQDTNRQLSCRLCFGHLRRSRKCIWNKTPYPAEAQSSPRTFFFFPFLERDLAWEGRRKEWKANAQENCKHISMDKIDLPAGKASIWKKATPAVEI